MENQDITGLLADWIDGDAGARDAVFERMYAQLKRIAVGTLRSQAGQDTFEPTALLNDALMKFLGERAPRASNREHFASIAARAMRQVLVDRSRSRLADKRGAGERPFAVHGGSMDAQRLRGFIDGEAGEHAQLHHFGRLWIQQCQLLQHAVKPQQRRRRHGRHVLHRIQRKCAHARAWLRDQLGDDH